MAPTTPNSSPQQQPQPPQQTGSGSPSQYPTPEKSPPAAPPAPATTTGTAAATTTGAPAAAADAFKQPECWTPTHEAELQRLAAAGEDASSIVELMVTAWPCLVGKLSREWVVERVRGVEVKD